MFVFGAPQLAFCVFGGPGRALGPGLGGPFPGRPGPVGAPVRGGPGPGAWVGGPCGGVFCCQSKLGDIDSFDSSLVNRKRFCTAEISWNRHFFVIAVERLLCRFSRLSCCSSSLLTAVTTAHQCPNAFVFVQLSSRLTDHAPPHHWPVGSQDSSGRWGSLL